MSTTGRTPRSDMLLKAVDTLLFKNPERTALGVMFGFSISGVVNLLEPALVAHRIPIAHISWWYYVSIGIVAVHLPFLLWSIGHKPRVNDEIEGLINLIEATNIGELEKRQAYRRVVNKCIDEFSLPTDEASDDREVTEPASDRPTLREVVRQIFQG